MSLTLELPVPLEVELGEEARREGLTTAEHATLLLSLANALIKEDPSTPFRSAVKIFLASRSLDADRLTAILEELVALCTASPAEGASVSSGGPATGLRPSDGAEALLRAWRGQIVHLPPGATLPIATDMDTEIVDLPEEPVVQQAGRPPRPSARGKYAHVAASSMDFEREKPREIALEERPAE